MADILVDEGIGQNIVQQLRAQGLHIYHALEFLPKGARDSLIFLEAQQRRLAVFTWNHKHFALLASAWEDWGHGAHHGLITRPIGSRQLMPSETLVTMERFCRDMTSFVGRIELF
jgi:hypothetical protein